MFTTHLARAIAIPVTMTLVLWSGGAARADAGPGARTVVCRAAPADCAGQLERELGSFRDRLGCDARAPFAAVYTWVQTTLRRTARERPGYFAEPSWAVRDFNAAFAERYFGAVRAGRDGRPVPEAWRIAFAAGRGGGTNAGQDVLLGSNAHIQRDAAYALAETGLVRPGGTTRKADYDRVQSVLDRAFGPAVREVARRYDPLAGAAEERWNPVARFTAHELFVLWRQNAWYYGRSLAAARDAAEFREVSRTVEANATAWATLLAAVQVPGYGLVRDAYCRGGRGTAVPAPTTGWTPRPLPALLALGRLPVPPHRGG
ncbi:hypothetical protein I5Q34_25830 [Streptomyces sp. AV19]|uniref:DUF5995 family protein n=1 Tax=Streptomyces sp. AV19 TaxID=2793068 RepID=UPI0018FE1771|nr:DUF5995 family protein [Streptomyces sp. AV19]MBH1937649.1 hypothetical protein [Streptomyces sp. AV19]MDG4536318.1 DUF5995 family protein [Streptomyces sp. AV19]